MSASPQPARLLPAGAASGVSLESAPRGALLRAIVAGGRDVLLGVSAEGWIERASDAAAQLLGRTAVDLRGMALEQLVRAVPGADPAHVDVVRPDGTRRRCALTAWPLASGFAVLLRDVAEACAAEAALRDEAEVARALLDLGDTLNRHLGDPYVLDWVTTIAVRLLGCDWSTVLGWDARRRRYRPLATAGPCPEDDPDALVFAPEELGLLDLLEPGGVVELADLSRQDLVPAAPLIALGLTTALCVPICQRRDVVGILIHAWKTPPAPSPRTQPLAVGIAQATAFALDNALRLAELQSASRMKSEFLSTLSHELRTPLNVLLGYSEMLTDVADAGHREPITGIARATVQLRDVVEGAQDLSWLDAGIVLEPEELDVRALAAELVAAVDPLRTADTALLTEDVPAVRVVLDRRAVYTVLKHLLSNACKFTPRGWVSLGVAVAEGLATFTVQDTGVGMAAEDVPACFERLRQIDGSNTRRYGGLGIGLYVVRRLVESHGGTVTVDTAPGAGTTVSVSLPVPR